MKRRSFLPPNEATILRITETTPLTMILFYFAHAYLVSAAVGFFATVFMLSCWLMLPTLALSAVGQFWSGPRADWWKWPPLVVLCVAAVSLFLTFVLA